MIRHAAPSVSLAGFSILPIALLPNLRGSPPKELRALGDKEFRQVFFKPDRLIYRIAEQQVIIYLIADGRRDMQTLLARRLLGG